LKKEREKVRVESIECPRKPLAMAIQEKLAPELTLIKCTEKIFHLLKIHNQSTQIKEEEIENCAKADATAKA